LTLSAVRDPASYDLHTASSIDTSFPIQPMYNGLVHFDPLDPNMSRIVPELAQTWEVSPDNTVFTFHLQPNVKFQQGQSLTAEDAKFSIERQMNPPRGVVMPRKAVFDVVDRLEVLDPLTLRIVTKRPYPSLLPNLAQGWMAVYSKPWVEAGNEPSKMTNGTGPFMFKSYTQGVSFELVRNPNYWKSGLPYLDGITYFIIPDENTLLGACRSNQIVVCPLNKTDRAQFERDLADKVRFEQKPTVYGGDIINLNTARKPFDDVRVRRALAYAIDRAAAIQILRDGTGFSGSYMPAHGNWGLPDQELAQYPGYGADVANNRLEAKKLLTEAGLADGFKTSLSYIGGDGPTQTLATFLVDQFAQIGVAVAPQALNNAQHLDAMNKGDFDLGVRTTAYSFDDPDAVYGENFLCKAPRNYSRLCVEEVDRLYDQQSQETDAAKRKDIVLRMERLQLAEMPRIMLPTGASTGHGVFSTSPFAIWKTVQNWGLQPSDYSNRQFEQVWLKP
jgi:peptide/nickel transport system substrate-binding protein